MAVGLYTDIRRAAAPRSYCAEWAAQIRPPWSDFDFPTQLSGRSSRRSFGFAGLVARTPLQRFHAWLLREPADDGWTERFV